MTQITRIKKHQREYCCQPYRNRKNRICWVTECQYIRQLRWNRQIPRIFLTSKIYSTGSMERLTSNTLNQKSSNKDLKSLLEFLVYYSEAQTNYITGGEKTTTD